MWQRDETREQRPHLHSGLYRLGSMLETQCPACKKETHNCVWCPNCGRMHYKADRLNLRLNVGLAVAVIMLGSIGAWYLLGF